MRRHGGRGITMTIAFGIAVASEQRYERMERPGIERIANRYSVVLTRHGYDSIQVPYNLIIEEAAEIPGLEALVLLHEDCEIRDLRFCEKVRRSMALPHVGVVG